MVFAKDEIIWIQNQQLDFIKRVLITGGNGTIGSELLLEFAKCEFQCLLLRRDIEENIDIANTNFVQVNGDIADIQSLDKDLWGATHVIHLAGLTHSLSPKKYFRINYHGTTNLVRIAEKCKAKRFFYISTQAIGKEGGAYSHSKQLAEDSIKKTTLDWTIIRPSEIYGEKIKSSIDSMVKLIKSLPIIPVIGNGKCTFNPLCIRDFTDFIYKLVQDDGNKAVHKTYTVTGPKKFNYIELIDSICSPIGKKKRTLFIPIIAIKALIYISSFLRIMELVPDQLPRLTMDKKHDITAAIRDYDFKPTSYLQFLNKS